MAQYLDNKEFYRLLVERKEKLKENNDLPVSNELGQMLVDLCTNLQYHRKFIGKPYIEECVGDAIENCLRYIDNFDPVQYNNPHAYFTQLAWNAFLRRIEKEERDKRERENLAGHVTDTMDSFEVQPHDRDEHFPNSHLDFEHLKQDSKWD